MFPEVSDNTVVACVEPSRRPFRLVISLPDVRGRNKDGVPGENCQLQAWARARSEHRAEPGRLCHLRNEVNAERPNLMISGVALN